MVLQVATAWVREDKMGKLVSVDNEYKEWLGDLKERIRQSQIKAAVRVNTEMLELYWSIGADIVERNAESKWGSKVLQNLSNDLRNELPTISGFSVTNLKYMKMIYEFYGTASIGHQVGDQLKPPTFFASVPWRHHVEIITKCKTVDEALFYIQKIIGNGWSRAMLLNFIKADLYAKQGKAVNNFSAALPEAQSDLAGELLKDPYQFDFITLTKGYKEKELEDALTTNITKFLLELGQGFSYYGKQVPLVVDGEEFALDLLFYHVKLHCYVAIELKAGKFHPKDLGQLGFYVSAVNHLYKTEADQPTVGLIICSTKNNVVAQYALESSAQPIGISEYELSRLIPESYQSALPSIEEIEEKLNETN
jgi:predicted nuclease of restriction endonuclease-like (RecB) superfamily